MKNLVINIKKITPVRLKIKLLQIKYFFSRFQYVNFPNDNVIISPKETLNEIKANIEENKNGAYIRFGDGDIFLINNKNKHRNQNISSAISQEMKDVISMKNNGLMKSLAIHSDKYGMEILMKPGSHERPNWEADYFINKTYKYFLGEKIYSPVSLHYQLLNDKSDIIDCIGIIKNQKPIFVGSEKNDDNILSNVFGVESFVKTPHRNAYSDIDDIEIELKNNLNKDGFNLVLLSCGPIAKILIKRILNSNEYNVFMLDLGSVVDVFHGRKDWTWFAESGVSEDYIHSISEEVKSKVSQ